MTVLEFKFNREMQIRKQRNENKIQDVIIYLHE